MALLSPEANLLENLIEKIQSTGVIRYIEQDFGQLENYEMRPAVSWPCSLIDIDETKYSDMQNNTYQMAEGMITVRTGLIKYTDANNLTPKVIREKGLSFYETERILTNALHGWAPAGFSKLLRRASFTEKRDDDIRVRVIKFAYSFTDEIGKKVKVTIARPDGSLGTNNPSS